MITISKLQNKINDIFKKRCVFSTFIILCLVAVYPSLGMLQICPSFIKTPFRVLFMTIIMLVAGIFILNDKKIDKFILVSVLYCTFQVISTFVNKAYIVAAVYQNFIIAISGMLLIWIGLRINYKIFINSCALYFIILLLLNIITKPLCNELEGGWLLGKRVHFFLYFIPLLFLLNFVSLKDEKKRYKIIIITCIVMCINLLLDFSITVISATVLSTVYYICFSKKKIIVFNIKVYLIIFVLLTALFVLPGNNNLILETLLPLIGKSGTASSRTPIYELALKLISERSIVNQIIGSGYLRPETYLKITDGYSSFHNLLLQVFYDFGIIGIGFFASQLVLLIKNVFKSTIIVQNICFFNLFVYLIRGVYESYLYYDYLFLISFIVFVPLFFKLKYKHNN